MNNYLLIDTEEGLKIVPQTQDNFFSSNHSVQYVGTLTECKQAQYRLNMLEALAESERDKNLG